ncbi:MAG: hypothetical protein L3J20_01880 [Flavobacteriaceae bacterium]|nr:hypothetical protein [Flavobacteriaceae bacterium]
MRKRKNKILKKLKEKGFLIDRGTIRDYEKKIKEQEQEIKKAKDKVSSEIENSFGSIYSFINFLRTL